jgi:hypothetical protein
MKTFTRLFLMLLFVYSAYAQIDGNPKNWCREGFFTRDSEKYSVVTVKGKPGARIYFYSDQGDDCPAGPSCATKAYVVPGDNLVVGRSLGKFRCAWYTPKKGYATVGWIEAGMLKPVVVNPTPKKSAWLGEWKYADNQITFTENKLPGFLNVIGDALWKSHGDNVHVGELDGRFEPIKGTLRYSAGEGLYDCKASMELLGNFLIVADNMHCGPANVTFSGVYRLSKSY